MVLPSILAVVKRFFFLRLAPLKPVAFCANMTATLFRRQINVNTETVNGGQAAASRSLRSRLSIVNELPLAEKPRQVASDLR